MADIRTKPVTKAYEETWERVWGKKTIEELPEEITFIVAGNHREFVDSCYANDMSPNDSSLCYLPEGRAIEHLRGTKEPKVVLVGTYIRRNDLSDIKQFVEGHNGVVLKSRSVRCEKDM